MTTSGQQYSVSTEEVESPRQLDSRGNIVRMMHSWPEGAFDPCQAVPVPNPHADPLMQGYQKYLTFTTKDTTAWPISTGQNVFLNGSSQPFGTVQNFEVSRAIDGSVTYTFTVN